MLHERNKRIAKFKKISAHQLWFSMVLVGFLSLLLWALEIGTDLNEVAELTI